MRSPLISVIIPVRNEQGSIHSCLSSLELQTYANLEIVVVDDGSTDKTIEIIANFPKVKLYKQKHLGAGVARNLGAGKAKGEILVFVDADMQFDREFITDLTKPILAKQAIGTWSGNEQVGNWHNLWARCWNYNQGRRLPTMIGNLKKQKPVFRAIAKKAFLAVGGFDATGYTDDWSLVQKIKSQPFPTKALYYHYNPDTIPQVFTQAIWIGKRPYKLGIVGSLWAMFRANAVFSLIIGLAKSIFYLTPAFVFFKLTYDLGIMLGAFTSLITHKRY